MREKNKKIEKISEIEKFCLKLYLDYCNLHFKYFFDPLGLLVVFLFTDYLVSPGISSLLYFFTTLFIRLPVIVYEVSTDNNKDM